jgi:hypothetical protein
MGITLVGSPPPAPIPALRSGRDIFSGDSSTFATSNGNWTNTGGTLTWDSSANWVLPGRSGSLKFASSANGHVIQVDVPGTFVAGTLYQVRFAVVLEDDEYGSGVYYFAYFGVPFTNFGAMPLYIGSDQGDGQGYGNKQSYTYHMINWVPSSDTSSCTFRIQRTDGGTYASVLHVGEVRVMKVKPGESGLYLQPDPYAGRITDSGMTLIAPITNDWSKEWTLGSGAWLSGWSRGISLDEYGLTVSGGDNNSEAYFDRGWFGFYAIPPDDTPIGPWDEQIGIEVGVDWVGLSIAELDDHTVGIYPDSVFGYDVDLKDRGIADLGWNVVGVDGNRVRLSDAVENPMVAVGDLVVGGTRNAQSGLDSDLTGGSVTSFYAHTVNESAVWLPGGGGYSQWSITHPVNGSVTFHYDFWISQHASAGLLGFALRLRRDSSTGTLLQTWTFDGSEGDHTDGHQVHWSGTYVDNAPTTGVYVLTTLGSNNNSQLYVYSDQMIAYVTAEVIGQPERLEKGSDGTVLAVDPATHALAWKDPQVHFQWPFYISGALTTGTDKAVYFQVPNKCKIDEVRAHVGTAPTGAALILDVNDDGTTIFTTQANRPTVGVDVKNLIAAGDSVDGTTFTTASVTLKAGRLYLMSVENSHDTAAVAVDDITPASGSAITMTSRSTTTYNSGLNRVSIWSGVASADYTGTLVIEFASAQSGATWSLDEVTGVDTTTTDGVVQQAVGSGSSTTPLATLSAFAYAENGAYAAHGHAAADATAPGTGWTELGDTTAATPAQALQTAFRMDNDTTADATITSAEWGSCAIELQADKSATSRDADGGTSVAKDSVLTIDIDQIGSSVAGADLAVFVRGHYIW